jgi:TadE-like protein
VFPVRLARDQCGAVLVEVTITMTFMFVFVLGSIDFLFAFYQWNAAAKAVLVGARIAAVSDPVAAGLNNLSVAVAGPLAPPGRPWQFILLRCKFGLLCRNVRYFAPNHRSQCRDRLC